MIASVAALERACYFPDAMNTPQTIEQRLASVERSLARTRLVNLGLLLGATALIAGGAQSTQDAITAKRLAIVDGEGRERIVLSGDDNGTAAIRVLDAQGVARISSGVASNNGSYTQWFDAEGRSRVAALCSQSGESSIQWRDANGKLRIGAATRNNGEGSMMWISPNGKPQIKVLTDESGTAKFLSGD